MWDKPVINRMSDDRLQLRHGPIRIVLKAWGAADDVRKALRLVTRNFPKLLPELTDELAILRQPVTARPPKMAGVTAQRMADAASLFADVFVTPMAGVAGAVAEEVLRILLSGGPLTKAYVNDGGDIALHLTPGESLTFGVAGDFSSGPVPAINGTIRLDHGTGAFGIATSGAQGRSFSLGIADSVTVFSRSGAIADVAATLVANAVNIDSPKIKREPARKLDPDSDLGDLLVTTKVGALTSVETAAALDAGVLRAQAYLSRGLIVGAALMLSGETRTVGVPMQVIEGAKR